MDASSWLAHRSEGGFTREVLSHFVFALLRVLGPPTIVHSQAVFPTANSDGEEPAEISLDATVLFGTVPVIITGRVGSTTVADTNVTTIIFTPTAATNHTIVQPSDSSMPLTGISAVRLVDWMNFEVLHDGVWVKV